MAELNPPAPLTSAAAETSSSGSAAASASNPDAGMGTAARAQKRRRLDDAPADGEEYGVVAPSVDHAAMILEADADEAEEPAHKPSEEQLLAAARAGAGSRWGDGWGSMSPDTADEQAPLLWAAEATRAAEEQQAWVASAHAADRARPRLPKPPTAFTGAAVVVDLDPARVANDEPSASEEE